MDLLIDHMGVICFNLLDLNNIQSTFIQKESVQDVAPDCPF